MRYSLLAILIVCFGLVSFGDDFLLEGYAPDFVGKKVKLYTYQDYITMTKMELGEAEVGVTDSMFRIPLKNKTTIKGIIEIEKTEAFFYIAPETNYQIYFPDADGQPVSFQNRMTNMMFFGLDSTDINYRILEYNQWFEMYIAYHYANISTGNFATYLDTFKVDVQRTYKDVKDEYFLTYVRYNIAEMEQVFNAGKQGKSRLETYINYIEPFPIYYENDQYMNFIKRFYTEDFEDYVPDIEFGVNMAIHHSSPSELMLALKKDLFMARPDIREMMMIDKLGKAFYKYNDSKNNILVMLDSVSEHSKYAPHATIAKNVKAYLTKLEYGFPAPYISLKDSADEEITWGSFEGQFVYFNFFATWNDRSVREMRIMQDLYRKYGEDVAFLSVCVDEDKADFDRFMKENPDFIWDIIYVGKDENLMESFEAKSVPEYFLIDQSGFIVYAPAASPAPDGEYESIESTLYEIYIYLHPRNERRLEKP